MPIPAENGSEAVDIPFEVGEDCYHIVKIERKVTETEMEDGSIRYGTQILLYVEPVALEKNTNLFSISASWGRMKTGTSYSLNRESGELEADGETAPVFTAEGSTWPPAMYYEGEYAEYRRELMLYYRPDETIPEKTWVRIDKVVKNWEQKYSYTIR